VRHGKATFDILESDNVTFDIEPLCLSQKCGYKVKEVPEESIINIDSRIKLF
jgi:hypothetical protein